MLYNIITNKDLKSTYAIPETEGGLNDLAFDNGWRIEQHAVSGKYVVRYLQDRDFNVLADIPQLVVADKCIPFLTADEWNDLVNTMYTPEESLLLCDSSGFSQYVEEQPDADEDEFDEDSMNTLEDPSEDADSITEL